MSILNSRDKLLKKLMLSSVRLRLLNYHYSMHRNFSVFSFLRS